jgi:uncharacterized repeat protein (TIGR02543 family)
MSSVAICSLVASYVLGSAALEKQTAHADGPSALNYSQIVTSMATGDIQALAFSHDDSSLYFGQNGGTGMNQITRSNLLSGGSPIDQSQDGFGSFRATSPSWQNTYAFSSTQPGKDGHYWIYSAAGNCAVSLGKCTDVGAGGLWAINTSNNSVSAIPLTKADGTPQSGSMFTVTGTPDGKYIYAAAEAGGVANLFKIDAVTNTQIGLGMVIPSYDMNVLRANNRFVVYSSYTTAYGANPSTLRRVAIDGASVSERRDSDAEILATVPTGINSFVIQDDYLISQTSANTACTGNAASGKILIINLLNAESREVSLGSGVRPYHPHFGADENLYAFDLCSNKVMQVDATTGQIKSQTPGFPNASYPFAAMSHDKSTYVVGRSANGGLVAVRTAYEASFDTKGGSTVPATYFGATVREPAVPTRDCSTFAGWSATDGGPAIPSFPYTPGTSSDITLYAKWNLSTCEGTPGATPNSKVVSIPAGVTEANIPANDALPAIKLNLAGATGQAVVTVAPISNPDAANSPFTAGVSAKIVDINVTGITGNVTVCLDGGAGDSLFHFTGGAWVALPERSYVNGQVCGVTSSFSPFTAAIPAKTPAEIAAEIAAAELASRTISAKQKYSLRSLASQTGIKIVSPKAKVTTAVSGSSKKVCTKSGSTLKTLVAGNCVVTYTIQEPKQTIKSFKSFAVGEVGSGSAWSAKSNYSMNAVASANGVSRSSKGKLSMTVAKSSKGICSKSGSNLKMLKAGTCNVTFTVQEPQPAATKATKTFVVK